jgi:hypothetical protein
MPDFLRLYGEIRSNEPLTFSSRVIARYISFHIFIFLIRLFLELQHGAAPLAAGI